jgi:hypothetical protein
MFCPQLTLKKKRKCHDEASFSQFKIHIIEFSSLNRIPNPDVVTVTDVTQLVTSVTILLFILDLIIEKNFS